MQCAGCTPTPTHSPLLPARPASPTQPGPVQDVQLAQRPLGERLELAHLCVGQHGQLQGRARQGGGDSNPASKYTTSGNHGTRMRCSTRSATRRRWPLRASAWPACSPRPGVQPCALPWGSHQPWPGHSVLTAQLSISCSTCSAIARSGSLTAGTSGCGTSRHCSSCAPTNKCSGETKLGGEAAYERRCRTATGKTTRWLSVKGRLLQRSLAALPTHPDCHPVPSVLGARATPAPHSSGFRHAAPCMLSPHPPTHPPSTHTRHPCVVCRANK